MSTYRVEWPCGDVTETDSWEPSECPICRLAEVEAERDTLRLRIAEVGEVLASDADEAALRKAVARLVYEARDMGGER